MLAPEIDSADASIVASVALALSASGFMRLALRPVAAELMSAEAAERFSALALVLAQTNLARP